MDEGTKDMNVFEILKSLIPVRLEAVWGTVVGVPAAVTGYMFGGWNDAIEALLVLMVLDYASGFLAACINPHLALNSQKGFKGIARKIYILLIVALAHFVDTVMGTTQVCTLAIFFYIANEGLSIVENAAKAGVPIPDFIKETLEQLSREKKAREKRG
jgi:toxin secretion/phage lysis holin